jgi:hypothetical protein
LDLWFVLVSLAFTNVINDVKIRVVIIIFLNFFISKFLLLLSVEFNYIYLFLRITFYCTSNFVIINKKGVKDDECKYG